MAFNVKYLRRNRVSFTVVVLIESVLQKYIVHDPKFIKSTSKDEVKMSILILH